MRIVCKIIYFLSIAYIALCCLVTILLAVLPLEFQNYQFGEKWDNIFFFGIPLAILFTLTRLGFKDRKTLVIWHQILATFLFSLGVFIIFFLYGIVSLGSMCNYSTGETVFTNRHSSTTKIVKRYFGCGATDSTPPTITLARQTDVLSLFWYYTKIDSSRIDRSVWMPFE
ncbi:MAG: hypothetical protein EOO07_35810 [Chitinophagaceae bacterium]|nr:MAG: hypothetical protein EOO07_35810 [Chitinophagaceae bacterium]